MTKTRTLIQEEVAKWFQERPQRPIPDLVFDIINKVDGLRNTDREASLARVEIGAIEQVLDLLEEAQAPHVTFNNNIEKMREEADQRTDELIEAAMVGLYTNVAGLKVREDLERRQS